MKLRNMYCRLTESILNGGRPHPDQEKGYECPDESQYPETGFSYTPGEIEAAGIVVSPTFIGHTLYTKEMEYLAEICPDIKI